MTTDSEIVPQIKLTEAAIERVGAYLAKEQGGALFLDVRKTGCSGWAYVLEIIQREASADEVALSSGPIPIVITPRALGMMSGTVIDFVSDGLVREFRFKNPHVTAECGCGESFTVDSFHRA